MSGWYAVLTSIRRQALAVGSISDLGFKVFAPIRPAWTVLRGRRCRKWQYPFGRYIFVEFDILGNGFWTEINRAKGVEYLICGAGNVSTSQLPIRIPERQMAKVFKWQEHQDLTEAARIGDIMRIISGPFTGHATKLTGVDDENYRATGEVKLFGRMVSCRFDLDQLERA